jgi:hypothetical protein
MVLVEQDGLSGAILDHALPDGDSVRLYARLSERGIPFIIYSGFDFVGEAAEGALYIAKPAGRGALVAAMEEMVRAGCSQTGMRPLLVEQ